MRLADEKGSLFLVILNAVMDNHNDTVGEETECHLLGITRELHDEVRHIAQSTSDSNEYDLDVHPHGRLLEIVSFQKLKGITRKH